MNRPFRIIAALVLALGAALPLQAGTVLEQTGLVSGQQSFVIPVQISGSGSLSVQLQDLGWLGGLQQLSFSLSHGSSLLSSDPMGAVRPQAFEGRSGPDVLGFQLNEAGTYYATVSGHAAGRYNLGLYGLKISFLADAPTVPLPAAFWLLASGLGALAGSRGFRRRLAGATRR